MPWLELMVPFLVLLAATSCLTVAAAFVRKEGEPWQRSLLAFLAASAGVAVVTAAGIFLRASGLLDTKMLYRVVGNLAFLMLTLTSWTALRTGFLVTRARPKPIVAVVFCAGTVLSYCGVLAVAARARNDLYFPYVGGVYAAMSLYLAAGLGFALAVVWKRRARLAADNRRTLGRFLKIFLPLGSVFLVDELLRSLFELPWFPLLPLAPLTLYGFVAAEIVIRLRTKSDAAESGPDPWQTVADGIASRCLASPLTRREREVLRLLLRGQSNTAIGDTLRVSQNTVKNHVYNLFQKVGVGSRGELALLADQTKLAT